MAFSTEYSSELIPIYAWLHAGTLDNTILSLWDMKAIHFPKQDERIRLILAFGHDGMTICVGDQAHGLASEASVSSLGCCNLVTSIS